MVKYAGLKIRSVDRGSVLYQAGIRSGDIIKSINGESIDDELDFRFFSSDSNLKITYSHGNSSRTISMGRSEGQGIEVTFYEKPINRCCNRCIFCFIDQMPPGLRSGLYIKDEDVKHSFVNGNYVTLSSLTFDDLEKAAILGISPLYISVHATDPLVRSVMLGNKKAPPVMKQLKFLSDHGMYFHTQIVLCPGYNDGDVLKKTLKDLLSFGDTLRSVAVVPVGITRFRKHPLQSVTAENAVQICDYVNDLSNRMAQKDGMRKIFCADELFLRASYPIPPLKYYEDFPQYENGVGLLRQLMEEWKTCKRLLRKETEKKRKAQSVLVVSSVSAYPFLKKICHEASSLIPGLSVDVVPVNNDYFGEQVTVAGLLTAKDVIPVLKKNRGTYTSAFLPAIMFNKNGSTLDGYSLGRISKDCHMRVSTAASTHEIFLSSGD